MIRNSFALFVFAGYYPQGGWNDFQGWFDSAKDAESEVEKVAKRKGFDSVDGCHWQVVDSASWAIVAGCEDENGLHRYDDEASGSTGEHRPDTQGKP